MGGIVIAYELGRALGVRAMFTERENELMTLRRGFFINEGEMYLWLKICCYNRKIIIGNYKGFKRTWCKCCGNCFNS